MELNAEAMAHRKARPSPPEINSERRPGSGGTRWWLWLILVALGAGLAYRYALRTGSQPAATDSPAPVTAVRRPPVTIDASTVRTGDFSQYLSAIGTVTPFYTVTIKSRVDGELMAVNFKEGQHVTKGELLAIIDPRPYQAMLDQAQGQLTKDRAAASEAKLDLQRDTELYNQHVIPQQQLDIQQATASSDEGAVLADQAAVDNARLQLTYSRITSPITGRIGLRLVDPGNIVHATDPGGLAVVTQLQPIAVVFSIPEDDLPRVMQDVKGGDAELPVKAYDRDFKTELATGVLLTLDNEIDQTTGTIKLKATFPNTDNALFPNQFVNVRLQVGRLDNTLLLPSAAIQRGVVGAYVYAIKPNHTVAVTKVNVLGTQGDITAASAQLRPGDLVAVANLDRLYPGANVNIQNVLDGTSQSQAKGGDNASWPSAQAPITGQGGQHWGHGHRHQ
jgi:membrane fusion protein, multidrug efflux system